MDKGGEVILSEPVEAAGKDYFRLAGISVSPDGRLAAWTADDDGSERFKLFVRDLATGADTLVATTAIGVAVWAADSRSVAWTEVNDQWRPFRVRLHRLGSRASRCDVLYEEADASFFVGLDRSTDRSHFPRHRRRPCHERGAADPDRRPDRAAGRHPAAYRGGRV